MNQTFTQHQYTGRISLEYWEKTSRPHTLSPIGRENFPECPDGRTTIEEFSVLAGWTENNYVRIRGYVHPLETGIYHVTSEGHVNLYISETPDTS